MWKDEKAKIYEIEIVDRRHDEVNPIITTIYVAATIGSVDDTTKFLQESTIFVENVHAFIRKYGEIRVHENSPFTLAEIILEQNYKISSNITFDYAESLIREGKALKINLVTKDGFKDFIKILWKVMKLDDYAVWFHNDHLLKTWNERSGMLSGLERNTPPKGDVNW